MATSTFLTSMMKRTVPTAPSHQPVSHWLRTPQDWISMKGSPTSAMLGPGLPPAPKIDGEAMLEVFVHRSLKLSGVPFKDGSPFVDGKRLAVIGKRTLEVVYLDLMFYKEPVLEAENLLETRILFDTYVGAVFVGGGYKAVRDWIELLVGAQAHMPTVSVIPQQSQYERATAEQQMGMGIGFAQPQPMYWSKVPQQSMYWPPPPAHALPTAGKGRLERQGSVPSELWGPYSPSAVHFAKSAGQHVSKHPRASSRMPAIWHLRPGRTAAEIERYEQGGAAPL
ncbi:hypothetical protein TRAPUB_3638 [Trametes pubescens]|uniref:RNase III domain-containing protein n=1 Tax=Trametes pubescens TaxID=154538 RepID=A0A1M2VD21_TRAPU|nr:hypothetical protein TRAPUB_3638 [Trametes pubescens]